MTAYAYSRRLNWSECDPAGIVFFPVYSKWAVDGFNEMLQSDGYVPNREMSDGSNEGIPCVEFNMRFFGAPRLYDTILHQITVRRVGKTSFTLRHVFSREGKSYAEILDTRVWATHGKAGLSKQSLPPKVLDILNARREPVSQE